MQNFRLPIWGTSALAIFFGWATYLLLGFLGITVNCSGESCLGEIILKLVFYPLIFSLAGLSCAIVSFVKREKPHPLAMVGIVGNAMFPIYLVWWIVFENPVTRIVR